MRRRIISTVGAATLTLGLGATLGSLASTAGAGANPSRTYYLALGDSVPVWNGNNSYPYLIASHYASANPGLQVIDMACSGETSASMIANSLCAPAPDHSQLKEALEFLLNHQGQVALITIDIGGNDLLPCINGLVVNFACIQESEATAVQNISTILSQIQEAAGPSVPIVGMNYYDPFLGDWLAGGSTQVEATLSVPLVTNLNNLLTGAYQKAGAPVADVASAFQITDLTDFVSSPWGQVPVAVDQACTLLDITCTEGQLEGFGDDPVDAGAVVIANAFEQAIGASITPVTTTTTTSSSSTTTTTLAPSSTSTNVVIGAGASSSTTPIVRARSNALAFTGPGQSLRIVAVGGAALALLGGFLLAAGLPERVKIRRR